MSEINSLQVIGANTEMGNEAASLSLVRQPLRGSEVVIWSPFVDKIQLLLYKKRLYLDFDFH